MSQNIDWTTYLGGNSPVASTALHIPYFPDGRYAQIRRIGNIVVATVNEVCSSLAPLDSVTAIETMPSGFRPVAGSIGVISLGVVVGDSDEAAMAIYPDGTVKWSNRATISGSTRFNGSGAWITKDAFPSS